MDVNQLVQIYERFETDIQYQEQRTQLMNPVSYIMGLKSKRIRPLLVLVGYSCYGTDVTRVLDAAFGIEIFHNFTLMHDDIMDEASLRRGMPATHIRYGINEAIISGDAMSIMAYDYIMKNCNDEHLREVLNIFNKTSLDICVGQQMDMEFEKCASVESEQYIEMIRLKTAVFLGMALQIGARIGGASSDEAQSIFEYGQSLGIAFQIQDDLLDLIGDQDKVGKVKGGDLIRNKKTFLVCKAHELADQTQRSELDHFMSDVDMNPIDKVEGITSIFEKIDLFKIVQSEIDSYFDKANSILKSLNLNATRNELLHTITQMIRDRKS
ncbi:polyprenyl synthetase family protein [Candidatus Brachybacter algidus]|uniref:polyprenyl synthetase family protein n=1 Tax=Candidatus Brachybacter algidus TaxID=2982024 RepID=UPI001DE7BD84|nr:polyprenyl synthetase family protein [Candidatus Brachybacter algidus]MBK6450039.1 polyprenyl synthetase family protein [Candidatus Brachybacter algidus]